MSNSSFAEVVLLLPICLFTSGVEVVEVDVVDRMASLIVEKISEAVVVDVGVLRLVLLGVVPDVVGVVVLDSA